MGVAYSAPFVGGLLADSFLGDYTSIVVAISTFYIPGLVLIALTAFPYMLGDTFNMSVLISGLVVLAPLGSAILKPVVSVFGAKQYHPVLQSASVSTYYMYFYMFSNLGALLGGIIINIVAERNVVAGYMIPVLAMTLALLLFLAFTRRYVRAKPRRGAPVDAVKLIVSRVACKSFESAKKQNGGKYDGSFVEGVKLLLRIVPISLLAAPVSVGVSNMLTMYVIQGTVMRTVGPMNASMMVNTNPIGVIAFGWFASSFLFPFLARKGITIPTTTKFAVGNLFGCLSFLAAIIVDVAIKDTYRSSGSTISVLWQLPNYVIVGFGEILCIAAAYDAAFLVAPKELKGLASAINLFVVSGFPQFLCTGLYNAFSGWFPANSTIKAYVESRSTSYLWVCFGISAAGVIVNLLPPVKKWVEPVEKQAKESTRRASTIAVDMDVHLEDLQKTESPGDDESSSTKTLSSDDDDSFEEIEIL